MYELKNKEDVEKFVNENVLTTSEAMEALNINRARLNVLVKKGRIIPLKQTKNMSLFWKPEVEQLEKELVELRKKYGPK
ncbi:MULTISPECIES: DNA-binding protein [Bacillus cereus group]|uniref:DNA-binding protein n=1 Tax=Bacillus dicomae TaxID=3088378 RepID=A0AC61SXE9_9BACI|nr:MULTISPECIES: DNA-binding protein [Bacillus cereus group]MBH0323609.1 DNA-binding protein [Bacillus cereus]NKW77745.1 DNA-binding protein [Bacillus cereus]NKX15432.1 DNA-binding protein [Bacillus cereus]TPV37248.1 DNA-binding protein [Bacillus dicomae]HEB2435807.1 DNA-binding protein [Bacillus cereus]